MTKFLRLKNKTNFLGGKKKVGFFKKQKLFTFCYEAVSEALNLIFPKQISGSQGSCVLKNSVERNVS